MKLNNIDFDKLNTDKSMKVSRSPIVGIIKKFVAIGLAVASVGMLSQCDVDNNDLGTFTPESEVVADYPDAVSISVSEVNDLNIIINGGNCSDSFVSGIAEELAEDGIYVSWTQDLEGMNTDNSIVITLDQQYISGPGMVIVAPYQNGRNDNSDALALSMQAGFNELGFFADEIQCGRTGYEELEDGTVVEMVRSNTEKAVGPNTSFVELCFGTQNTSAELVGKAIKLSVARFANYLKNEKVSDDLLFRIDEPEMYGDEMLPENTVLKSDSTLTIDSFDKGTPIDLGGLEASIWYQK